MRTVMWLVVGLVAAEHVESALAEGPHGLGADEPVHEIQGVGALLQHQAADEVLAAPVVVEVVLAAHGHVVDGRSQLHVADLAALDHIGGLGDVRRGHPARAF